MFNQFLDHIRKIDQFWVVFQLKIKYFSNQYKTTVGGIMSIILYGQSFSYLLYSFVQYAQGNILPKITTIQAKADHQNNFINPFNPTALVLLPLVLPFKNNEIPPSQYFNFDQISFSEDKISIRNIDIKYGNPSEDETEQIIAFVGCKQVNLPVPFVCANESIKNQFFTQSRNAMIATTQVNQFNIMLNKVYEISRLQFMIINILK